MKWMNFVVGCFCAVLAHAESSADTYSLRPQDSQVVPFGHNFSATSYLLDKGRCSIGVQAVGCGITGNMSLATSPWLWSSYNTANLFARIRLDQSGPAQDTLQLAYFKTYRANEATTMVYDDYGNGFPVEGVIDYQMEAAWVQWIRSYKENDHFVQHINVNLQYYWDDRRPFSLRRPTMRHDPANLNLTDLFELHLNGAYYLMSEIGIANVIADLPELVAGMSWQWREKRWMAHLGFSVNSTGTALFAPDRVDSQRKLHDTLRTYRDDIPKEYETKDYAIHPEFSLQYYF